MRLRDRIDAICALVGLWGSAILKYYDDLEARGLAGYGELLEALEIAEMSELLGWPLLTIGATGWGRIIWTSWRAMPERRARPRLLPRR